MESHVNSFNFLDWKHYWHFSLGNLQRQVNYYLQFKSYLFKTDNTRYGRKRTIFWSNFVYFLGNLGTSLSILIYHFMADFEAKPFMSMVFTCIFRSVTVTIVDCKLELETKVHPKVCNHGKYFTSTYRGLTPV